ERDCFVARSGLPDDALGAVNLVETPPSSALLEGADVIFVGGSGDYSVARGGFDWHQPLLALMREIVDRDIPMFASCFGFQALVQALGGEVGADPARAELGTWQVTLTERGVDDPLFGALPRTFDAQFGHNDSALRLPQQVQWLARSPACDYQALRVTDRRIWATQYHPELTDRDNIKRYLRYLESYRQADETMAQATVRAESMHRPSPESNQLLARFIALIG